MTVSLPARVASVGALALSACVAYQPGTLQRTATSNTAVAEVGCLDLAAEVTTDVVAAWPVVDLRFGNRCARPVPVDLGAIAAFGRTAAGTTVRLVPFDPERALRSLPLEARTQGGERLQYRDGRDLGEVGADVIDLCLDLATIGGGSPAPIIRCWPRPVAVAEVAS